MMSTKTIEPDEIEKLILSMKRSTYREPFNKLFKGLRSKIFLQKLKGVPIFSKNIEKKN